MIRYALRIAYVGTEFFGWQRQPNRSTVQAAVEHAISTVLNSRHSVTSASRTDTGVHAEDQVAVFRTEQTIHNPLRFLESVNALTPPSISIWQLFPLFPEFRLRDGVRSKSYRYQIWNQIVNHCFLARQVWHLRNELDFEAMRQAGQYFVGTHDFRSFTVARSSIRTTVRRIDALHLEREGSLLTVRISGPGFLQHMVRIVVGSLVEIGKGARSPDSIPEILSARDRRAAGRTAPAQGLTLERITLQDSRYPSGEGISFVPRKNPINL